MSLENPGGMAAMMSPVAINLTRFRNVNCCYLATNRGKIRAPARARVDAVGRCVTATDHHGHLPS